MTKFEQKNRKRPMAITDIAIDKIRRTKIYGFDNAQNAFIQECHKYVLREAQKLNRETNSNDMEAGMLIDLHTWETWMIDGVNKHEVEMSKSPIALQKMETSPKNSLMFIHNHPSSSSFSGEDLRTFCNQKSLYMITVVGNDSTVYLLVKEQEFDSETVLNEYGKACIKYLKQGYINNNGTMAMRYILKNANKFGLFYKKGSKV